jgi:hypothetical protein
MAIDPGMLVERLGALLLIVAIVGAIADALVRARPAVVLVMLAALVVAIVPFGDLSATDYLFSVVGPLSGASLTFLALGIADALFPERRINSALGSRALAAIVLLVGIPFYAFALGFGGLDAYRLGFGGWTLSFALAALLAFAWLVRSTSIALWLALSGALYLFGAFSSRNLFDYLIDPVVLVLAAGVLIRAARSRRG